MTPSVMIYCETYMKPSIVLLHQYEFLWKFHQVHHSVKEMGFAAHLRYHWMENIFYKPLKTIAVMLLGGYELE